MSRRILRFAGGLFVAALLALGAGQAGAECNIAGTISAAPNSAHPELGAWRYTLEVRWRTGSKFALSHFDVLLAESGGYCTCRDFDRALNWVSPAGSSNGDPAGCPVPYDAYLECNGDPSIGEPMIMIKFEPREEGGCEPGTLGTGTYTFYSSLPPAAIAQPNLFLVDKFGLLACYGPLSGVFPGMPCDPTPQSPSSWGVVKSRYR